MSETPPAVSPLHCQHPDLVAWDGEPGTMVVRCRDCGTLWMRETDVVSIAEMKTRGES